VLEPWIILADFQRLVNRANIAVLAYGSRRFNLSSPESLARLDRKRKKRTSNKHWKSPADGDARIAKMKDKRTHLAHKAEHAVDLDTGAVLAVGITRPSARRALRARTSIPCRS
jgi:hypothetical protein